MSHENESASEQNRDTSDSKHSGRARKPGWERRAQIRRFMRFPLRVAHLLILAAIVIAVRSVLPPEMLPPILSNRRERPLFTPPHTSLRLTVPPPLRSSTTSQQLEQRHTTAVYWKVAVSELHPHRFGFVEDPNEPASQFYRRWVRDLTSKVQAARTQSSENVDKDLVKMAKRHLTQDEEALRLMGLVRELAEARGDFDDTTSVADQYAKGEQLTINLTNDPSLLDQIEDPESRALVEALYDMDVMRLEQLREIEIMQARLQERYPLTSFALPEPPE
jgi:hypothetical protein